ncbi:MAG: potassium channel family protein [Allosphingosinicella sp.]|uniref:potassium channel family protein n=1 Tax=Allosphingosinicella sp. TaxID=2823234 RepID=UPI00394C5684
MLLALLVGHMIVVWLLMYFVGEEEDLRRLPTFIYWYATTASTIGYGDLSPKTDAGRLINAFVVYPGAIAIFTGIITKAIAGVSDRLRRARAGMADYSEVRHAIVLVGHDPVRTPRMIDELCADAEPEQELILLTTDAFDNVDPRIRYVRAASLTSRGDLERAGVADADRVIIFAGSDNDTLAAGLAIADLNERGHIVCYFEDEAVARLLTSHCPNVDAVLAPAVELVVKAVKDPGASHLLADLVSATDEGMTLFSMDWRAGALPFRDLSTRLLDRDAVLVAYRSGGQGAFRYAGEVTPGDRFFYVAGQRLRPELVGAAA